MRASFDSAMVPVWFEREPWGWRIRRVPWMWSLLPLHSELRDVCRRVPHPFERVKHVADGGGC